MGATLAERIRAIVSDPTPAAIAELLPIALKVQSIERALDEIAADALESANLVRPPPGRRPHLTVVE